MRIQSSITRQLYDIDFGTEKKYHCPECTPDRKKKKVKDLQFYPESESAYCFHCSATFFKFNPHRSEQQYKIPEWKNKTNLTDKAVKWFEGRGISQKTLIEMKIYSDTEYMPQFKTELEVICFPYFVGENIKNIKYRGPQKSFKLFSGAELVLFNHNVLDISREVLICEGEMDCLTWIDCGYKFAMSVPNGANKKIEWLDNFIHKFENIEKVYINSDNDSKGIDLRDELIRRIGIEKCYMVNLKECKDANDYRLKYGGIELINTLKNAKQKRIDGILTADDMYNDLQNYFKVGDKSGLRTGIKNIDEFVTWESGRMAIVTGIPGSGKSEFIDFLLTKLNLAHGWKAGFFTPENYPLKYHYEKIYEKLIGKKFSDKVCGELEFDMAYEHIRDNFFYVLPEENTTIEYILDRAKYLIKTKGIKAFVIDPYNKLEHNQAHGQTETQYISKFLDKLIHFGKIYDVLMILIAHPVKMQKGEVPTLYNVSGSSHFYNKADYGLTVHREFDDNGSMTNDVQVHWQKIKFKNLGKQGCSNFRYNYNNGRFEQITGDINSWDNSNWLVENNIIENIQSEYEFWNEISEKRSNEQIPF